MDAVVRGELEHHRTAEGVTVPDPPQAEESESGGQGQATEHEGTSALRGLDLSGPCLVLLVGVSGSGKSTYAAQHFAPTEVVSLDRLRAMLTDDAREQSVNGEAMHLAREIVRIRLDRGLTVVLDATNLSQRWRRQLLRVAAAMSAPVTAVVFDVPLDVCIKRNAARSRVVPESVLVSQREWLDATVPMLADEVGHVVWIRE
jgi:predicted kinase